MRLGLTDIWSADFETTTETNYKRDGYVRVWLWSLVRCDLKIKMHGNDMFSFLENVKNAEVKRCFFYNLRFRRILHRRLAAAGGVCLRPPFRHDHRRHEHMVFHPDILERGPQEVHRVLRRAEEVPRDESQRCRRDVRHPSEDPPGRAQAGCLHHVPPGRLRAHAGGGGVLHPRLGDPGRGDSLGVQGQTHRYDIVLRRVQGCTREDLPPRRPEERMAEGLAEAPAGALSCGRRMGARRI